MKGKFIVQKSSPVARSYVKEKQQRKKQTAWEHKLHLKEEKKKEHIERVKKLHTMGAD